MSQKPTEKAPLPDYPRAPPLGFDDNVLMQRPAPPSYEESQQPMMQSHAAFNQMQYQQQPYTYAPQMYGAPQYMAVGYQAYALPPSQQPPVLTLARGAEIRTTAGGAVTIPPPPPGYAPTPAQWAAMQGQQVLVKEQKKRSFFS